MFPLTPQTAEVWWKCFSSLCCRTAALTVPVLPLKSLGRSSLFGPKTSAMRTPTSQCITFHKEIQMYKSPPATMLPGLTVLVLVLPFRVVFPNLLTNNRISGKGDFFFFLKHISRSFGQVKKKKRLEKTKHTELLGHRKQRAARKKLMIIFINIFINIFESSIFNPNSFHRQSHGF